MSLELIYHRYLKEKAVCVIFPMQNKFREYYQKSIFNKLCFRLGWSGIYKDINEEFIEYINVHRPDAVWVFKGMELFPQTLKWIKSKGILLCCYNPDHPFIHSGRGSGNDNVTSSFKLYDFHFVYGLDFFEECKQKGFEVYPLPFAYDLGVFDKASEIYLQEEIYNKACFIGNPDKKRAKFIEGIIAKGISIDIYGLNWTSFLRSHKNLSIKGPVYGIDLWKTFRKYRVQLNLLRRHNLMSHNQRTFELAGVGAIQVAPRTPDHELYFSEDKEIFLFSNIEECSNKIRMLLSCSKGAANELRKNVLTRVESDQHNYQARAGFAFATIKNKVNVN